MAKEVWIKVNKFLQLRQQMGECFSFEAAPGVYDFLTVGLHELGHALGLAHSSVKGAVMWPYTGMGSAGR